MGEKLVALMDACTGCGACAASCGVGALAMRPDAAGFLRPVLDAGTCLACGHCERVCPALNERPADAVLATCWAYADAALRARSSSGGVFGALARATLARGGAVYGAAFSDDFTSVSHERATDLSQLERLLLSKYVQSAVGAGIYRALEEDIARGAPVLFCGTACQVAGLKAYLGAAADSPLLTCADVVCHGAPSPALWRRYLAHWEEKQGARAVSVCFRGKERGWRDYTFDISFENGAQRSVHHNDDWYLGAFMNNATLRACCFSCPVKGACGSDLTLADFWGVEKWHPQLEHRQGISAIIVRTEQGRKALEGLRAACAMGPADYAHIAAGNPSLNSAAPRFPAYGKFMREIAEGISAGRMMRDWNFSARLSQKVRHRLWMLRRAL